MAGDGHRHHPVTSRPSKDLIPELSIFKEKEGDLNEKDIDESEASLSDSQIGAVGGVQGDFENAINSCDIYGSDTDPLDVPPERVCGSPPQNIKPQDVTILINGQVIQAQQSQSPLAGNQTNQGLIMGKQQLAISFHECFCL